MTGRSSIARVPQLFAAFLALASAVAAGEAQDRVFRVGMLADVPIGQTLIYLREQGGTAAPDSAPATEDGAIKVFVVERQGERVARMEMLAAGRPSSTEMPADGGHPVLLAFLESTARFMAEATGGSPFYIRNRMRESFAADVPLIPVEITIAGNAVAGQAAIFRPFASDPNRDAMGTFADLALTMVLSDAVPGEFARFEAATGPGAEGQSEFSQIMIFDRLGEN